MDTKGLIITMVVSLVGGLIGGYLAGKLASAKPARTTGTQTRSTAACIEGKLGKEKAVAIAANPALATAEDNFKILPCYGR